eukprot:2586575-Amphidinium_carterae.1
MQAGTGFNTQQGWKSSILVLAGVTNPGRRRMARGTPHRWENVYDRYYGVTLRPIALDRDEWRERAEKFVHSTHVRLRDG